MSAITLVCFALEGEAKPFRKLVRGRTDIRVLVTGMGQRKTERAIQAALQSFHPRQVFTCGVAGALDPALRTGDVLFETCDEALATKLQRAGAKRGKITCAPRVVITGREKKELREKTGADMVEMESAFIQHACTHRQIACATVRVVSDMADEDLPLDMNAICDAEQNLSPGKLALSILKAPHKIPALMQLGRKCSFAAQQLARTLIEVV